MSGSVRIWAALAVAIMTVGLAEAGPDDDQPVDVDEVIAQAVRMAELIESSDVRVHARIAIGRVQGRMGRHQAARQTLTAAEAMIYAAAETRRPRFWLELACARSLAGMEDDAHNTMTRAIAEAKALRGDASSSYFGEASYAVSAGDFAGARRLAGMEVARDAVTGALIELRIATEAAKADDPREALAALARAEASKGDPDDGQERATSPLGHRYTEGLARAEVARAVARAGRRGEALALADSASERAGRIAGTVQSAYVLAQIALARREAGDEAGAVEAANRSLREAESLEDVSGRVQALTGVAIILGGGGMHPEGESAFRSARQRTETDGVALQMTNVAEYYALLGKWPWAEDLLRRNADPSTIRSVRLGWIRREARDGHAERALEWAEGETTPEFRVNALIRLLEGIADRQAKKAKP